jgi:hypothetical protein
LPPLILPMITRTNRACNDLACRSPFGHPPQHMSETMVRPHPAAQACNDLSLPSSSPTHHVVSTHRFAWDTTKRALVRLVVYTVPPASERTWPDCYLSPLRA